MVHALELVHDLLIERGFLVDIHPTGEPPRIEVRLGGHLHLAGWLNETDDYIEYIQASQALNEVVTNGLFALEREGVFSFSTCANSLSDLCAYLAETWQDAVIDEQVAGVVEEIMQSPEVDKEIILREQVKIARYRRLGTAG